MALRLAQDLGHLYGYCQAGEIPFTRGRPYQKDDNAPIEQKNWTHVRRLLGYLRYDSPEALGAIHDLYQNEVRLFQNLPSAGSRFNPAHRPER